MNQQRNSDTLLKDVDSLVPKSNGGKWFWNRCAQFRSGIMSGGVGQHKIDVTRNSRPACRTKAFLIGISALPGAEFYSQKYPNHPYYCLQEDKLSKD